MSNRAAYGPGKGAIGFERLGTWHTNPQDQVGMGPPYVFTSSGIFRSVYGELYEILGAAGGGSSGAGSSISSCCFVQLSGGGGGGGGGGFLLYWVGDGNNVVVTVGGVGGTTSFGSIVSATGGNNGSAAAGSIPGFGGSAGSASGQGVLIQGTRGGPGAYPNPSTTPTGAPGSSPIGMGYGAGDQPGIVIIRKALPALNSQRGSWEPQGWPL